MADVGKRVGPTALGTSAATVHTVPGATSFHMRNIHVVNTSGAERQFTMSIGADAAGTRWANALRIAANGNYDWNGYEFLATGEIIQAYGDVAGLTLTIGGVEQT